MKKKLNKKKFMVQVILILVFCIGNKIDDESSIVWVIKLVINFIEYNIFQISFCMIFLIKYC